MTSVIVMLLIMPHRVRWAIRMMVMRQNPSCSSSRKLDLERYNFVTHLIAFAVFLTRMARRRRRDPAPSGRRYQFRLPLATRLHPRAAPWPDGRRRHLKVAPHVALPRNELFTP